MRTVARPLAVACLAGLLSAACSSAPQALPPVPLDADLADEMDEINRLSEYLATTPPEAPELLWSSLQRLMLLWQSEQRDLRSDPLEHLIARKVIANFDTLAEMFETGDHGHKLVTAWALGFSRVPTNPLGIDSPHPQAVALIVPALQNSPDDLLRNLALALWKIGDPQTPLQPLLDLTVGHHDAQVRANAALAVCTVSDSSRAALSRDAMLVALTDSEPKVRLHASLFAALFPHPTTTQRIEQLLIKEQFPHVRACMAKALGSAGSRSAAPLLIQMLESPRWIEASYAHLALIAIYGEDLGQHPTGWLKRLP
jgi:hypothetical protein